MNCKSFRLHIDAYADDALSPAERLAFEAHRADCGACQQATEQARQLGDRLRMELSPLAAATPTEQVSVRESVLRGLDVPSEGTPPVRWRRRVWALRLTGIGAALALALLAALAFPPGANEKVSAAEIVDRARAAVDRHEGLNGVLHWEAEWSQRFASGDQITRTFEIWFSFDHPGHYRLTQRDPEGLVFSDMVRDGKDHMWQLSRTVAADGSEQVQVDEIIMSPKEMQELGSWYVPSPFLDDLDRFTKVLNSVEKVGEMQVAGRPAYILRGQLYGLGQPDSANRIDPVTSTVQLVVDAETYWVLGRTEHVPAPGSEQGALAGVVQRTRAFEILPPEQVPPFVFAFTPPAGAQVRTSHGIAEYYAPTTDAIGLKEAATLTSFTLVLPSELPNDLKPRPHFRYTGPGRAGTFGIVYLGHAGRQAFLLEFERARVLGRAARMVAVGQKQGWLVPDPIDGRRFSLYLAQPEPAPGPDGRPWPGGVELQAWGLSLDEAVAMLASLEPFR